MCQLFLPSPGIDRRDESPRFQACESAKKKWESFIAYHFNLFPKDSAYQEVFPYLDIAKDLDRLSATNLDALSDFYDEAHEELRINILMCNDWDALDDEWRFTALQHWTEWCDGLDCQTYLTDEVNNERTFAYSCL